MANQLIQNLKKLQNKEKARIQQKFFKTGKGEYAEGDIFLGVIVPEVRKIAKKNISLQLDQVQILLISKYHEVRLLGLIILTYQYANMVNINNEIEQKNIVNFYLSNTKYINNWDLVDASCYKILGEYCYQYKLEDILSKLTYSSILWERRISIVSCFAYIKKSELNFIYSIIPRFFNDKHDLIHKACGWMLREAGKRNKFLLENFLKENFEVMPKIMLRYALEKFSENEKSRILK
ncbi:DNA alkylation repair protein [Pigmentibacter sp. JX0631]|uniref:DNA alkylation repair protein n=1 Tax=Pigmentibacter sp. JX0631 TaxID=2976982 RepID=UPI002469715B|nr:DNA alkylation repair protein [Pigmentibacter sp. JX0631]WGL59803.1 DNA alkylation repair protein [Pigmentibacter sp. JX0631]